MEDKRRHRHKNQSTADEQKNMRDASGPSVDPSTVH